MNTHKKTIYLYLLVILGIVSCTKYDANLGLVNQPTIEDSLVYVTEPYLTHLDTIYVPIYSDIYSETKNVKFNLTATLSMRNTSFTDSIYISGVDYYDSKGEKQREYLSGTIMLTPMQSIEVVIPEDDTAGGTGANFIIYWGASTDQVLPIFQGVMISTHGQQGISFLTDGVSISRKR